MTNQNSHVFEAVWDQFADTVCLDCDVDSLLPHFEQKAGITFPAGYSMLEDYVNRFEINPSIWPIAQAAKRKIQSWLTYQHVSAND